MEELALCSQDGLSKSFPALHKGLITAGDVFAQGGAAFRQQDLGWGLSSASGAASPGAELLPASLVL